MLMALVFIMGIVNFALHRAVLARWSSIVDGIAQSPSRNAGRFTLGIEFGVLVAALLFASDGGDWAVWAYAIYTFANVLAAWLVFSRRS